jgi:mono/diheme cytochrome c family protein
MKSTLTLATLGLLAAAACAAPITITLPAETATFKPGKGAELAQANCLVCHSVEYIATQPPMPRKFWEANVKKMIEKYAAPIPAEATATLAEYLTTTYGVPDAPKP